MTVIPFFNKDKKNIYLRLKFRNLRECGGAECSAFVHRKLLQFQQKKGTL